MSDLYLKARVLLLDEKTQETIGECEIVSDSKEIFYNNPNPLPRAVGNMPAGTVFDKASLANILDDILYDKACPWLGRLTSSNGDISNTAGDIEIIKAYGTQINDFTMTTTVYFGTYDEVTVNLYVYTEDDNYTSTVSVKRPSSSIGDIPVSFDVPGFNKNADIWVEVVAGNDKFVGPRINYRFVSPIYVGWITSDILNEEGNLDKETAEHYFQELIDHNFNTLDKRFVDKSNQAAFIMPNINYDTREYLLPCILVPQTWGEVKKITDTNGSNITNTFAYKTGLDINTHEIYIEHYTAYVCRHEFANDSNIIRGITYIWDDNVQDINMANIYGRGIPMITGFSAQYNMPMDDRFSCKTYGDLLSMKHPYPGLQTYVEDINTTFRFERGHWTPVSTKFHVIESLEELTEEFGGWDDLAINAMDGKIWKKRYNNQWERYGDIKAEDGKVTFELNKEDNTDGSTDS